MNIEDIEVFIGTGRRQGASTGPRPRAGRSSTGPCPTTRSACVLSTRSWLIMGTCWWWSISLPPSGALAVAVAQDMGTAVG